MLDAGQIREHVILNYSGVLLYGGSMREWERLRLCVKRLSGLAGLSQEIVTHELTEDARIFDADRIED